MSEPTTSILLNSASPAAPDGFVNTKPQSDSATPQQSVTQYVPNVGGVSAKTANYTAVAKDNGTLLSFNSSSAVTLTLPSAPPFAVWKIAVQNIGTGVLTISRNGLLIDTAATNLTLAQSTGVDIYTDGTNYLTQRGSGSGGGGGGGNMNYTGSWSNSTSYNVGDVAKYSGHLYMRLVAGGGGGGGTPSVVQAPTPLCSSGGVSPLAFGSNVTAGNLLLVAYKAETNITASTITDTRGTTYTKVASISGQSNNLNIYAGLAPSSGANTVTIGSPGNDWDNIAIMEVSNASATLDGTPVTLYGASSGTAMSITAAAGDFIFCAMGGYHNSCTFTLSPATLDVQQNGADAIGIGHYVPTSGGTQSITFTNSSAGDNPQILVAFQTSYTSSPDVDTTNWIEM